MARILITGAQGFVGRHLARYLAARGLPLTLTSRNPPVEADAGNVRWTAVPDVGPQTDWRAALEDVEAIVHLAGRAHVLRDTASDPEAEFRRVNDAGTGRLVDEATGAGVRRFVHFSSIAAAGRPVTAAAAREEDAVAPDSAYGRSKLGSEAHVARFAGRPGASAISLRPPLIYGPGAPGNWGRLVRLARCPLPLPFGSIRNRRTFLGIDNLVDAVAAVLERTRAEPASGVFNLADAEIFSLRELITWLREGLHRPPRLVPFPPVLFRAAGRVAGKSALVETLIGDLVLDTSRFRRCFAWTPPQSTRQGVMRAVSPETS